MSVVISGNAPAFSAYLTNGSANQSISASTYTKVKMDTETFDTNSNFDATTNYRFTPTVAGYYQINASIWLEYSGSAPSIIKAAIYKNGSLYKLAEIANAGGSATGQYGSVPVQDVIQFNGSTDYVEFYAWSNSATAYIIFGSSSTYCSGCIVRGA